jgi:hypothetical protein
LIVQEEWLLPIPSAVVHHAAKNTGGSAAVYRVFRRHALARLTGRCRRGDIGSGLELSEGKQRHADHQIVISVGAAGAAYD